MSVHRVRIRNKFATIPNAAIRDRRISLRATGLLCLMLSYPDDWEFRTENLLEMKKEGRDAFRTARQELVDAGYVTRMPRREADGYLSGWEWLVTDDHTVLLETSTTEEQYDGGSPPTKTERPTKTESLLPDALPSFVDPALWAEYEKHRAEKRSKLTATARQRALALLAKHPTEANAMITRTLERGWTGLFAFSDADRRSRSERRHADDAAAPSL